MLMMVMMMMVLMMYQTSSDGQDLVDAVCEHLNLAEKDYFSCSYRDSRNNRVSLRWFYSARRRFSELECISVMQLFAAHIVKFASPVVSYENKNS